MTKKTLLMLFCCVCLPLTVAVSPLMAARAARAASQQEPIELSLNMIIPPIHMRWLNVEKPWVEELEKRTGGRIKIMPHFAASLTSPQDNFDSVITGIADMALGITHATPGRFLMDQALWLSKPDKIIKNPGYVYWQLYKKFPELQAEYSEVHVLFLFASPWEGIAGAKKPILKIGDLKGMKMFSAGGWPAKVLSALGATPINMPLAEVVMAIEKGVIDGAGGPYELLVSRKYGEVLKHFTDVNVVGYTQFYMVMSKSKWDSLPKDIQKIFNEMSGEYAIRLEDEGNWKINEDAKEIAAKEMGVKFYDLPPEEMAKFVGAVQPVEDAFATELESKGLPGKKLMKEWDRLQDEYGISFTK
jgi:TRAP-type C4-dicarboxylate transport system substrate-binding protein